MYVCICAYVYVCICTYACLRNNSVYMYAFPFIYTHVWVYICTRVGVFCLFLCQSLYYMRVYQRCLLTAACVRGRGLKVGGFSTCSW